MDYLSIGLIYFFEFLITISFCNRVMDKRLKTSKILIFTFPLYIIGFALYFIFENLFVNVCVSIIVYFCTMLIGYKETIIKKVVYTAYLMICMYLSEVILVITLYDRCRTDFADIQNKKECGGNRQWQRQFLRKWAANTKGKAII